MPYFMWKDKPSCAVTRAVMTKSFTKIFEKHSDIYHNDSYIFWTARLEVSQKQEETARHLLAIYLLY
jgi:hypothetical protein